MKPTRFFTQLRPRVAAAIALSASIAAASAIAAGTQERAGGSRPALLPPNAVERSAGHATIEYRLPASAKKVVIAIVDAGGAPVRTFVGPTEDDLKTAAAQQSGADQMAVLTPPTGAGTHAVTWDLRYSGAPMFPELTATGARADLGPVALPGQYQVRLSVDGGPNQTRP